MPESGTITCAGRDVTRARNRRRRELGMAIIPADRNHQGLSPESTLIDNLTATRYHRAPFARWGVLSPGRMRGATQRAIDQFDIRVRGPNVRVRTLSGGNAQKVVLAREIGLTREIEGTPQVVIAAQPTRGLDVGAMEFVHTELAQLRDSGAAILVVSADLDELFAVTDRLLVIFEGRLVGALDAAEATREQVGLLMAGRATVSAGSH